MALGSGIWPCRRRNHVVLLNPAVLASFRSPHFFSLANSSRALRPCSSSRRCFASSAFIRLKRICSSMRVPKIFGSGGAGASRQALILGRKGWPEAFGPLLLIDAPPRVERRAAAARGGVLEADSPFIVWFRTAVWGRAARKLKFDEGAKLMRAESVCGARNLRLTQVWRVSRIERGLRRRAGKMEQSPLKPPKFPRR